MHTWFYAQLNQKIRDVIYVALTFSFSNTIDESEKAGLEIGMRCTKCCRFFISNLLFFTLASFHQKIIWHAGPNLSQLQIRNTKSPENGFHKGIHINFYFQICKSWFLETGSHKTLVVPISFYFVFSSVPCFGARPALITCVPGKKCYIWSYLFIK